MYHSGLCLLPVASIALSDHPPTSQRSGAMASLKSFGFVQAIGRARASWANSYRRSYAAPSVSEDRVMAPRWSTWSRAAIAGSFMSASFAVGCWPTSMALVFLGPNVPFACSERAGPTSSCGERTGSPPARPRWTGPATPPSSPPALVAVLDRDHLRRLHRPGHHNPGWTIPVVSVSSIVFRRSGVFRFHRGAGIDSPVPSSTLFKIRACQQPPQRPNLPLLVPGRWAAVCSSSGGQGHLLPFTATAWIEHPCGPI